MKIGNLRIPRIAAHPDHGSFGVFVLQGEPICLSLEEYWRENASNISCIPTGQYRARRFQSSKYGLVWRIDGVHGRRGILIHWGNTDDDTEGCVITGEEFEPLGDKWAVRESKRAFDEFMRKTEGLEELVVTVVDAY